MAWACTPKAFFAPQGSHPESLYLGQTPICAIYNLLSPQSLIRLSRLFELWLFLLSVGPVVTFTTVGLLNSQ